MERPLWAICWVRVVRYDSYIDDHVVPEIFISRNKSVALLILEANAPGSSLVKTVEIFDRSHDRVCGIMREYLNSHWQPSTIVGRLFEDEFECDMLWRGA